MRVLWDEDINVMLGFGRHVPNYGFMHFWSRGQRTLTNVNTKLNLEVLVCLCRATYCASRTLWKHIFQCKQLRLSGVATGIWINHKYPQPQLLKRVRVSRRPSSKWHATLRVLNSWLFPRPRRNLAKPPHCYPSCSHAVFLVAGSCSWISRVSALPRHTRRTSPLQPQHALAHIVILLVTHGW